MHTLYASLPSVGIHTLHKALLVFQKGLQITPYFLRTVFLTPSQEIYFEMNFLSEIFSLIYPFVSKRQSPSPMPCLIWNGLSLSFGGDRSPLEEFSWPWLSFEACSAVLRKDHDCHLRFLRGAEGELRSEEFFSS